jgi:hypothetical protein
MTTNIPKKLRRHLANFCRVTGVYIAIIIGLGAAHQLMGLIAAPDDYEKIGYAVAAIYLATVVWFSWRFYTGVWRDGDFLE